MRAILPPICTRCADRGSNRGLRPVARLRGLAVATLTGWGPTLHAHGPQAHEQGTIGWTTEPWVVVPLVTAALLYAIGFATLWRASGRGRRVRLAQAGAFAGGWSMLVIGLVSPLDGLADRLFWVHMVQHEILMLIAAPLLVLGRPLPVFLWALPAGARQHVAHGSRRTLHSAWRVLSTPASASVLQTIALWAWHAPAAFSAALRDTDIHAAQHASFLFSATLFWWALLRPRRGRNHGSMAVLYLFGTMLHTGLLGALLTFSPTLWYEPYRSTAPAHGLSPLDDQQLGGLIMWVPGGLAYLGAGLWRMMDWLGPQPSRRQPSR